MQIPSLNYHIVARHFCTPPKPRQKHGDGVAFSNDFNMNLPRQFKYTAKRKMAGCFYKQFQYVYTPPVFPLKGAPFLTGCPFWVGR